MNSDRLISGIYPFGGLGEKPVDEDGDYATDKEKVDYLFFGLVVGFAKELGYFSLTELQTLKEGLRGMRALPIERDVHFRPQRLTEIRRRHEEI